MIDAGLWGDAAQWYPEVVALGAVDEAWQAEFDRLGSSYRVRPEDPANPRTAAIGDGKRNAYLILSPWRRRFILGLRTERMVMLSGHVPDLAVAAYATQAWLSGERGPAVAAVWPFFGSVALAEARERGDHIEAGWLHLYENHRDDPVRGRLQPFAALAFHEPRLRRLRPFTSHWTLAFSTTSTWPFTGSYPWVTPAKAAGRYIVTTVDRRTCDETDAAGAVRLVLTDIPQ